MGSSSAKRLVVPTVNPLDELSVGFGREETIVPVITFGFAD